MTTTQALAPVDGRLADAGTADDEAVASLLVHITAAASALLRDRLAGSRAGTVATLLEIASLAGEALSAAGAAPAVPAAPARDSAKAIGAAILEAALAGNTNVPVGTVLGLGGRRFTFSPDFAEDSAPWHYAGGGDAAEDPMPSWSTSADLVGAGAEVIAVPVPVDEMAPKPAAEMPADDSPAALQVAALAAMGDLIRALPADAAIGLTVDRHGELEATARLWPGIGGYDLDGFGRNRLATFQALHRLTGAQLTASPRAGRELHLKGVGTWRGVAITIRGLTDEGEPATIAAARAWLAELGVEVKA